MYFYTQMNSVLQDFTYNMEAQKSLLENNSCYVRFSPVTCFPEICFQTIQLLGFLQFIINARSLSQGFEERHCIFILTVHCTYVKKYCVLLFKEE